MLFRTLKDDVLQFFKTRTFFASLVIAAFGLGLILRLFYLQVIQYNDYARLSDSNRIRINRVPAERGFIFDRNGNILVKNVPAYELRIVKEDTKDLSLLLKNINKIIPFDMEKAKKNIKKSYLYEPTVILRGLDFSLVAYFLEHSADYDGLQIDLQSVRDYSDGVALSHVLGYMGEVSEDELKASEVYMGGDVIGKGGVENFYENVLRGVNGARQVEVNNVGRILEILNEKDPEPGKSVFLTLDYNLQKYISDTFGGDRIAITVMDITDNSILAMYSGPTYDLNTFTPFIRDGEWNSLIRNANKPLMNRNIEGRYPPGSVYKVVMALAGLKEGLITTETTFKCTGSYRLNARFVYNCWKRAGHGDMNLRKALAESCDVYFYSLGRLLEIDKIQEYSNFFSFGHKTGIDLPNEKAGFFPSKEWKTLQKNEAWFPGETIITSIGQGYMNVTPLQVGVMMSGIFNGGKIYKPHVAYKVVSNSDGTEEEIKPVLLREMDIPLEMDRAIMSGLEDAVYGQKGTSRRARVDEFKIGGKTGTAQVVSLRKTENMRDEDIPEIWRDHSWFTGVFPSESPRYVIVVMREHGGGGGASAAPIGGKVIKKMMELGYVKAD